MIIVSDTSPVSNLILVGEFSLLKDVFQEIIIPPAVDREIRELERFAINLDAYKTSNWVKIITPKDTELVGKLNLELDLGESEAITLAKELNANFLLIDERLGSFKARETGLQTIGLLGVLVKAKDEGYLSAAKPLLEKLRISGFWMSNKLVQAVLERLKEG